jgi:uncharacterized protein YggE
MTSPQVVVRGEAVLVVDPEIADVDVTVRVRARDRQTALERCSARQDEVTAVVAAAGDAVEAAETTGVSVHLEVRDRRAPGEPVASLHTRLTLGRLDAVGDSGAAQQARLAAVRDAVTRARQYAAAFGAQLTALVEVSDTGLGGDGLRVATSMSSVARFESEPHLDLVPARQEVHGGVEVRFTMSEPDQEVFRR